MSELMITGSSRVDIFATAWSMSELLTGPAYPNPEVLEFVPPAAKLRYLLVIPARTWVPTRAIENMLAVVQSDVQSSGGHFAVLKSVKKPPAFVLGDEGAFVKDSSGVWFLSGEQAVSETSRMFDDAWSSTGLGSEPIILYARTQESDVSSEVTVASREIATISDDLIRHFAMYPQELREVAPRKFEELVAELLARDGMKVTLTPPTRDGGRDILVVTHAPMPHLYLVECKRYSEANPVGVATVRALYGVVQQERATAGLLVTTSTFTKDASRFAESLRYQMSLRDYTSVVDWLKRHT